MSPVFLFSLQYTLAGLLALAAFSCLSRRLWPLAILLIGASLFVTFNLELSWVDQ